ncbi:MAG: alanyl-tRNA editing protein [Chloroflexota bacterium]
MSETHKLYRENPYQISCKAEVVEVMGNIIRLDKTVFYGEAGGQIGDTGRINNLTITDAQHSVGRMLLRQDAPMIQVRTKINHITENTLAFAVGDSVKVEIDWERRYKIMRMHSAGHLVFYYALKLFGPDGDGTLRGNLKGCRLGDDNGRFDFPSTAKLSADDIQRIQDISNEIIAKNLDIAAEPDAEEPDLRWWTCGEIGMYCGGTHVRNTREIGEILVKRRAKGKGLERVYLELNG